MSDTAITIRPWGRNEMAQLVAEDIQEGWFVNLGIGIPTLVANYVPCDKEVIFQSENGVIGVGPAPEPDAIEPWLINAGKQYVTLQKGGAYVHHADSFAMIRGGHLDLCVLGAYEVSAQGDIANWSLSHNDTAPAVGGAMDLSVGAKRVWILMDHVSRTGTPRLLSNCTLPLTAKKVVSRVYTNLAVLSIVDGGFKVIKMAPGVTEEYLAQQTDAELI